MCLLSTGKCSVVMCADTMDPADGLWSGTTWVIIRWSGGDRASWPGPSPQVGCWRRGNDSADCSRTVASADRRESAGRSPGHGHRTRPRAVVVPRPPGTDDDLHRPTPRCCWATRTVAETPGGGRIVGGSAAGSRSVAESTDAPGRNREFQFPELGEPVDDDRFDDSDVDRASYTPGQTTDEEQASSASGPVDPAGFDIIASTERRAAPIYRAPTPPDVAALSLAGDAGGTSAGAGPPLTPPRSGRHLITTVDVWTCTEEDFAPNIRS